MSSPSLKITGFGIAYPASLPVQLITENFGKTVYGSREDCVQIHPQPLSSSSLWFFLLASRLTHHSSLGQFAGVFDIVENVTATNIRMSNAENGARIKAFAGSGVGSGKVNNITFSGFVESAVDNSVVIDQCYETSVADCEAFPSNVFISNVLFNTISGTGTSSVVADLACSPGARCANQFHAESTLGHSKIRVPKRKPYRERGELVRGMHGDIVDARASVHHLYYYAKYRNVFCRGDPLRFSFSDPSSSGLFQLWDRVILLLHVDPQQLRDARVRAAAYMQHLHEIASKMNCTDLATNQLGLTRTQNRLKELLPTSGINQGAAAAYPYPIPNTPETHQYFKVNNEWR
ncbi:pectin lyase fold/virulence factor [Mycena sanguinolenta]|nr:pectin lyase fold/virulence factor [Mycena sanguinolenta]